MKKKLLIAMSLTGIIALSVSIGVYAATAFKVTVNGKATKLDVKVINKVDYVPLNEFAALLGQDVKKDTKTNSITVTKKAAPVPTATPKPVNGISRSNPAPIGTKVNFKNTTSIDKFDITLSVDSILRGDKAWELISAENQFNEAPKEGYEYILATISAKVTSNTNKEAAVHVSDYDFTLVSTSGKDYEHGYAVLPKPEFAANLYIGASNTGYVVFLVKKDDATPLITYGRKYDGTNGVWFKVS